MLNKYLSIDEILKGRKSEQPERIGWNTVKYQAEDKTTRYRYTNTDIVTITADGSAILNTNGWRTKTTKSRINTILAEHKINAFIKQDSGRWLINFFDERQELNKTSLFYDGMKLTPAGIAEQNAEEQRKAEIQKEITQTLFDTLDSHFTNITYEHVEKLCRQAFEKKEQINQILGLNEANQFRRELTVNITSEDFQTLYPRTADLFKTVAEGKKFDVIENYIEIGNQQKMRFTRFLARNKEKLEQLKNDFDNKVCDELKINSLDDINIFRDKLKPKKLVISTNPLDFITSTEGSSFTSCYSFDGCYFNSTIALCRSSEAVLVYVYDDDRTHKIGRSWAYLFPEARKFIMLKAYGSFYEAERKQAREFIEEQLSRYFQIDNKWKRKKLDKYENYTGHQEPIYFDSDNVDFIRHESADTEQERLNLPQALCLACGDETSDAKGAVCESCFEEKYSCLDCGCSISEDDLYTNEYGEEYCYDCYHERYFSCQNCGEEGNIDDEHYAENYGSYCCECYHELFVDCYECNTPLKKSRDEYYSSEQTEEYYCSDCYHEQFARCEDCDAEIERSDAKDLNGHTYCDECYNEQLPTCETCSQRIEPEEVKEIDGNTYCETCCKAELKARLSEIFPDLTIATPLLPARTEQPDQIKSQTINDYEHAEKLLAVA